MTGPNLPGKSLPIWRGGQVVLVWAQESLVFSDKMASNQVRISIVKGTGVKKDKEYIFQKKGKNVSYNLKKLLFMTEWYTVNWIKIKVKHV